MEIVFIRPKTAKVIRSSCGMDFTFYLHMKVLDSCSENQFVFQHFLKSDFLQQKSDSYLTNQIKFKTLFFHTFYHIN
jgi:hypothetical protein